LFKSNFDFSSVLFCFELRVRSLKQRLHAPSI